MYFRPCDAYKDFTVEEKDSTSNTRGRNVSGYAPADPAVTVSGILADASPFEKERWKQLQHPITHTIVQQGTPKAKEQDRLILSGRRFYIQGIDNPLGVSTLYYVEERRDA